MSSPESGENNGIKNSDFRDFYAGEERVPMTVKDVMQRAGELEFLIVHLQSELGAGETVSDIELSELLSEAGNVLPQLEDMIQYGSTEEIDIMNAQQKTIVAFVTKHKK
jgi:hypothetical protein